MAFKLFLMLRKYNTIYLKSTNYNNIDFIIDDVFTWSNKSSRIKKTDLIINTSCEHMLPMKNLRNQYGNIKSYFAWII